MKPPRFYLLPGIDYIIRHLFPLYYNTTETLYAMPGQALINQYIAGSALITIFQLGLIISIIVSLALYIPSIAKLWKSTTRLNTLMGKIWWYTSIFIILQFIYWWIYVRIWLFGHNAAVNGHIGIVVNYVELMVLIIVIGGTILVYFLKMMKLRDFQKKARIAPNISKE